MRKYFFVIICLFSLSIGSVNAQDYMVKSVLGGGSYKKGKTSVPIQVGNTFDGKTTLITNEESKIEIISLSQKKLYTLVGKGASTLERRIHAANINVKTLSAAYFVYLCNKIVENVNGSQGKKAASEAYASIERSSEDSMMDGLVDPKENTSNTLETDSIK